MGDAEAEVPNRRGGHNSTSTPTDQPLRIRPIPESAIWWGAAVLLVIAVVSVWLLIALFGGGSPQDKIRLEAIKLAGSIVIGTGGAVALVLAARRQRATELQLLQQERTAADTRHDAEERRISDLQASAGEQLGNEKAAVRLNGLYQLERLGQNHPDHRQAVVDVICAYLRMPFTHPDTLTEQLDAATPEDRNLSDGANNEFGIEGAREEVQVRLTAQRILAKHLRPDLDEHTGQPTNEKFWGHTNLDLTGAVLTEFDLTQCHITDGNFRGARFHRGADFTGIHFHRGAVFNRACFLYLAAFDSICFQQEAEFVNTEFHDLATFDFTRFQQRAEFYGAYFHGPTGFEKTCFRKRAEFCNAHFQYPVEFNGAFFHDTVRFAHAQSNHALEFANARRRWDVDRRLDAWPEGWTAQEPATDDDGHIEGEDGVWGYVVPDTLNGSSGDKD